MVVTLEPFGWCTASKLNDSSSAQDRMSKRFEKLTSFSIEPGINVEKYRATRTGLTVCVADVPGPIVNGFFCLATEAHDDDGLPHTLEHLIFLGSEQYPYKGVLDSLANRCFARGTNAWTDVDHTCYTLTTAGSEGFLQILPIYLDHILYPTLLDDAYTTEVHHITGKGEDAGVVYSEMQARENTMDSIVSRDLQTAMYPGNTGYKSETGGKLENLRTSTSNEKVREYHREFYRPENLCLIVTGHVDVESIFSTLQPVEDRIVSKGARSPFERPWQSSVPPLESKSEINVTFPSDNEESGLVVLAWRGPNVLKHREFVALTILLEYLASSPVSPLYKVLIDCSKPLSSIVVAMSAQNKETNVGFMVRDVPTVHLQDVYPTIHVVLEAIQSGGEGIDMSRLSTLIEQRALSNLSTLEDDPHLQLAASFIQDFLYSMASDDLRCLLDTHGVMLSLCKEPETFWLDLLKKFLMDAPHILVTGEPSHDQSIQMADEEERRVAHKQASLGEDGLHALAAKLAAAIEKINTEIPTEVLTAIPVPSLQAVPYHAVDVMSNCPQRQGVSENASGFVQHLSSVPMIVEVDDIKSSFLEVKVIIDTSALPDNLRPYLLLWAFLLFESPVLRNGELVDYEKVVVELEQDFLEKSVTLGFPGSSRLGGHDFTTLSVLSVKSEISKYGSAIHRLIEILCSLKMVPSRVQAIAQQVKQRLTDWLRSGMAVAEMAMTHILFQTVYNEVATSGLTQQAFLTAIIDQIEKGNSSAVVHNLEQLVSTLIQRDRISLLLVTDVAKLDAGGIDLLGPLKEFAAAVGPPGKDGACSSSFQAQRSSIFLRPFNTRGDASTASSSDHRIIGLASEESSHLIRVTHGVSEFNHPDLAVMLVLIEYLMAMEGPMWRELRGTGLAYSATLTNDTEAGLLFWSISKSIDVAEAYGVGKKLLMSYADGDVEFENVHVEAAVSSLTFTHFQREQSPSSAAAVSFLNHCRNLEPEFRQQQLVAISKVTANDLNQVAKKYFAQLFEPGSSKTVVCCNSGKVDAIADDLCG